MTEEQNKELNKILDQVQEFYYKVHDVPYVVREDGGYTVDLDEWMRIGKMTEGLDGLNPKKALQYIQDLIPEKEATT